MSLISSLLTTYRRAFREEHYGGLWKEIFERYQRPLHQVFMNGSEAEAEAILSNPTSNYLHYGFENTFKDSGYTRRNDVSLFRTLSIALGADLAQNPEAQRLTLRMKLGTLRRRNTETADRILAKIESLLGNIPFPNPFQEEGGTPTYRGVASHRALYAIYQASLLQGRVLEIGGGLGRTAFYANIFGVTDYTIVDLPFTGISQGYFLGKTLPNHSVTILSPDEFFDSDANYDVVINVDSLTEMAEPTAKRYADAIRSRAKTFISINNESNPFTVRSLLGRPYSRNPDWFRPGYVEERYLSAR